jgi:hypothetical protein
MIIIESLRLASKILEIFLGAFSNSMISNIVELILKLFLMAVLFYMVKTFVRLAYFFKDKKEEKMSKFQKHTHSFRHGIIMFFCIFLGILSFVDSALSIFIPIDQLINPDTPPTFKFKLISGFIIRGLLDFVISLGLLYLFYCLGMRRLWVLNNPNQMNTNKKNNKSTK